MTFNDYSINSLLARPRKSFSNCQAFRNNNKTIPNLSDFLHNNSIMHISSYKNSSSISCTVSSRRIYVNLYLTFKRRNPIYLDLSFLMWPLGFRVFDRIYSNKKKYVPLCPPFETIHGSNLMTARIDIDVVVFNKNQQQGSRFHYFIKSQHG